MKSEKKNKRKAPKRARAKPQDENKAVDHAGASDSEDVRASGGSIEYEDAATFQRRNEALLHESTAGWADSFKDLVTAPRGITGIGDSITPALPPDRRRRWMRRRLKGVIRRLAKLGNRGGRPRHDKERKALLTLLSRGLSLHEATKERNKQTGHSMTPDAYRQLLNARSWSKAEYRKIMDSRKAKK